MSAPAQAFAPGQEVVWRRQRGGYSVRVPARVVRLGHRLVQIEYVSWAEQRRLRWVTPDRLERAKEEAAC